MNDSCIDFDRAIADACLSVRTTRICHRASLKIVGDLEALGMKGFLKLDQAGMKAVRELKKTFGIWQDDESVNQDRLTVALMAERDDALRRLSAMKEVLQGLLDRG